MSRLRTLGLALALALGAGGLHAADMIDINTATAKELEAIKGIGPAKAKAIIEYRTKNGPFKSVDDLVKVPGIGDKAFADIKGMVSVGSGAMPAAPAKPAMPAEPAKPKAY